MKRVGVKVLASDGQKSAVEAPGLKPGSKVIVDVESGSEP
jgi:hypothetical protein